MADGEASAKSPEEIFLKREALYAALEEIEKRERKVYRERDALLETELAKRYDTSAQSLAMLTTQESLDAHINGRLKEDEDVRMKALTSENAFSVFKIEKDDISDQLVKNGEDVDRIYAKMYSGNKLAKNIAKKVAELENKTRLDQKLFLEKMQARKDDVAKETEAQTKKEEGSISLSSSFDDTIVPEESTPSDDPFNTEYGSDDGWEVQAQADFDVETNKIKKENARRAVEKEVSENKFEEGTFGPDDTRSQPISVFDPVPEQDFQSATVDESGGLSLAPIEDHAARDQEKYESMMRFDGIDTSHDPFEFKLDAADRAPIQAWRNKQNTPQVVTQADIEAKNKTSAEARKKAEDAGEAIEQTVPNTFLPEDSELLTADQKTLLNPQDPGKVWNEALNGSRDREFQNAKSTEELISLLAGKYANGTFGLGGRKKTGRQLANQIMAMQGQENAANILDTNDRELAQKVSDLQDQNTKEESDLQEERAEDAVLGNILQQRKVQILAGVESVDDSSVSQKLTAVRAVLKRHSIPDSGFMKALKGGSQEEKLRNLARTSSGRGFSPFHMLLSAVSVCVDLLEVIALIPVVGSVFEVVVAIIKYTTLIPLSAYSIIIDVDAPTRYIMLHKMIRALRDRGILLLLNSLAEFIPVAGALWPGTTLLLKFLINIQDESKKCMQEVARAAKA